MTKLAHLAALALALFPACIPVSPNNTVEGDDQPPPSCGGYTGGNDKVYSRAPSDTLIECGNGGFVVEDAVGTIAANTLEGMLVDGVGIDPATAGVLLTPTTNADGSLTILELGSEPYAPVNLDAAGLDHADAACQALTSRSWWGESLYAVPAPIELVSATAVAPYTATTPRLVLCPSSSLYVANATGAFTGTYELDAGEISSTLPAAAAGVTVDGELIAQGEILDDDSDAVGEGVTWRSTTADAAAAANFCATGVFTP